MVTIIDVAKYAGVSKTTVSAVLNKKPHIKEETRRRVEDAVRELGYVCNNNARGLRKRSTNCLGIIIAIESKQVRTYEFNYETGQFSYGVSNGVIDGLDDTDYGIITERYCPSESGGELPQLIKNARVDGAFLVGGLFTDEMIENIRLRGIPMVGIGHCYEAIDSVFADVAKSMYMECCELLRGGCRKIALINCPASYASHQDRIDGWNLFISEHGREIAQSWQVFCDTNTGEGGYLAIKALWESGVRPDGIATANEPIALGVMRFLSERGVRVPDDISITSYEASVLGGYCSPPLTSINIQKEYMGAVAARLLMDRIADPQAPLTHFVIEPQLLARASVKAR